MFSPLLKSCFPYAIQPLMYEENDSHEIRISIRNGNAGSGGGGAVIRNIDGSESGGSSCSSNGRRYLPPCEPPPPTPSMANGAAAAVAAAQHQLQTNVFKVTEIEYALPFIRRRCEMNGRRDCDVIYENINGVNGSIALTDAINAIQDGNSLQVKFFSSCFELFD